jgi:hypothetical protein
MYVFDYLDADPTAYVFRAPTLVARLACAVADRWSGRTWDYAPTPEGL